MDCDGRVEPANDLPLFVDALLNPDGYVPPPGCAIDRADTNGDGAVDGADIEAFIAALLDL